MHYVKQFDINGVATKQVACIELHGKPNAATEGCVGVLGIDMDSPSHDVYKCSAVNGSVYTWELLSSGMSIIVASGTGFAEASAQFPYANMKIPANYLVKIGDLIIDSRAHIYQINALHSTYCIASYCTTVPYGKDGTVSFDELTDEQKESLKGEKGVGISSIQTYYCVSDSSSTPPTTLAGWKKDMPTVEDGKYLWTQQMFVLTNQSVYYSYICTKQGKEGTSVTITNVSESTASGGSNVVTFSDGKTLTVKNGIDGKNGENEEIVQIRESSASGGESEVYFKSGSKLTVRNGYDGTNGKSAYQYAKEGGYAGTEAKFAEKLAFLMGYSVFGYVDENMDIILKGNITNGAYLKLVMEDGSTIDIAQAVLYYEVTNTLTNCVNSNSATSVVKGGSYSATITANSGYELKTVSVTMGGSAVSVTNGVIDIASVTGDIVITAVAEEATVTPSYTNYAENFEVGRLKSAGTVDSSTTEATTCSDYIPFTKDTVVRVKGFGALTDYNCALYDSNRTVQSASKANASPTMISYSYDSASGVVTMTALHTAISLMRVSGKLTGTTSDVIITVNEEIV